MGALLALFDGTDEGFWGGLLFLPVVYFLFQLVIEQAKEEGKTTRNNH